MPGELAREKQRAEHAYAQRGVGARLAGDDARLAVAYELAATLHAELVGDADLQALMVRRDAEGRELGMWDFDEWQTAILDALLSWSVVGMVTRTTPRTAVKRDVIAYVERAQTMQRERRGAVTSGRMEVPAARARTTAAAPEFERLRARWDPSERPVTTGRVPRPQDVGRMRKEAAELERWWADQIRDARAEHGRQSARVQELLRRQRGIEVVRGPGGTVTVGPKRMGRGRKRGGR
jgi:hypothetical protein